jgi:hypothetical protein
MTGTELLFMNLLLQIKFPELLLFTIFVNHISAEITVCRVTDPDPFGSTPFWSDPDPGLQKCSKNEEIPLNLNLLFINKIFRSNLSNLAVSFQFILVIIWIRIKIF